MQAVQALKPAADFCSQQGWGFGMNCDSRERKYQKSGR